MAAARKKLRHELGVLSLKLSLVIEQTSLAFWVGSALVRVTVGICKSCAFLRSSGRSVGMESGGRLTDHLICLLARIMSPYVTGEKIGMVMM